MNIEAALKIIKHFEGCYLSAYRFPGEDWWTIGWGNTTYADGRKVREGDTLTQDEADRLLEEIVHQKQRRLRELAPATDNFDDRAYNAVLSWFYNHKPKALPGSNTLRYLQAGDRDNALFWCSEWTKSDRGEELGLIRRRMCEFKYAHTGEFDWYKPLESEEGRLRSEYLNRNILMGIKPNHGLTSIAPETKTTRLIASSTVAILEVKVSTYLKLKLGQAKNLDNTLKVPIPGGSRFPVRAWKEEEKHYRVTFDGGVNLLGRNTVWAYSGHCTLTPVTDATKPTQTQYSTPKATGLQGLLPKIVELCDREAAKRGGKIDRDKITIVGIEGMLPDGKPNNDAVDQWNDTVALLWFENGQPRIKGYRGTTEPGHYYRFQRLLNPNGCAVLDTGYHPGLWAIGQHRGYKALQQVGVARLVRDRNKNGLRDDKITLERDRGINCHRAAAKGQTPPRTVGRYSAGCCVILSYSDWEDFLGRCVAANQSRFDFCLLWRDWLVA